MRSGRNHSYNSTGKLYQPKSVISLMSSESACMGIMNVVYLNVRTLLGGKEYILIQDLIKHKIDIEFLSEVRWYEQGDITKDEYQGYHFLC